MKRKRQRVALTSEWLQNWAPAKTQEVGDKVVRGLFVRSGASGAKTFYRWEEAQAHATGETRRRRVRIGRWRVDGGGGTVTLKQARDAVLEAKAIRRAEASGVGQTTVEQLAQAYRQDVLTPNRERADEAWNVIRVHVVEAQLDPKQPLFGRWPAKAVRPADVAAVVRHAAERRTVDGRRLGGPGAARVTLRELKAIFAHAVETGALEMTPAAVLRVRSFGIGGTSRERTLNAVELRAFFEALDLNALLDGSAKFQRLSPTVRLALAFQLYVPLRSQSLIGARWEEIDLKARMWTVPVARLKLRKSDRPSAKPFVVPLPETAVAILARLRDLAGTSPWVLASPAPEEETPGPSTHVDSKALIRALSRLQESGRLALGARLTVHDLRRTWRTWAQELSVDDTVAERSLGHATALRRAGFSAAADVYGRAQLVEQRAAAAEIVGAAFDRIRLGASATVVPITTAAGGQGLESRR